MIRAARLLVLPWLATGCTLEAGEGFATMTTGSLEIAFEPGEQEHRVRLDAASVHVTELALLQLHDSERYEPLVTMPIDRELDVLDGERAAFDDFQPSGTLPQATLDRIELAIEHLDIRGEIEGDELAEPIALEIDLPLDEPLATTVSYRIDRDGPEQVALDVTLHLDATMLDELELEALAVDGRVAIDEDSPAAGALLEWLQHAEWHVLSNASGQDHEEHGDDEGREGHEH